MDNAIRYTSTGAVGLLAAVAGWISYTHVLTVCGFYHVPAPSIYAYPITVDGLIYVASMMLLHFARNGERIRHAKTYAWATLVLGIGVTGAANAWAGLPYGVPGAVIYAWPAVALVLAYEGLMLLIRNSVQETPETQEPAKVRHIMRDYKVGYPKAKAIQATMNGGSK